MAVHPARPARLNCFSPPGRGRGSMPNTPAPTTWPAACARLARHAKGVWLRPWPAARASGCGAARRQRSEPGSSATGGRPPPALPPPSLPASHLDRIEARKRGAPCGSSPAELKTPPGLRPHQLDRHPRKDRNSAIMRSHDRRNDPAGRRGGRQLSSHRHATPAGCPTVAGLTDATPGEEHDTRDSNGSVPEDPIGMLTRRARRAWRRVGRQIVREHEGVVAGRLGQLATLQLPVKVTSMPETGPAAIAGLSLPGWQILLAGVALGPRIALSAAARSHRLRLSGAGRYGRFWWLRIDGSQGVGVILLGSHLRLNADLNGPETHDTPPPADLQLVTGTGRRRHLRPSRPRRAASAASPSRPSPPPS
jgi:hypothetical protein